MTPATKNVAVLSAMSAILGAQMPIYITLGGLAGATLAHDAKWATLPVACQMIALMIAAYPISMLMGKFGRRPGFYIGVIGGGIGGILAAYAMIIGEFWLLCLGHAFAGIYQSAQGYYRFAATDLASEEFKPKAISYVLAGGLIAAILGAEIFSLSVDYFAPIPFAGAYAAITLICLTGSFLIPFVTEQTAEEKTLESAPGRDWRELLSNPTIPISMLCAMLVYGTMTLVMTASPLAMVACGFANEQAAHVVKWHVIAMFGPSFFTGSIIARFGARPVIATGLLLLLGCTCLALIGIELNHFYGALILLGLGWNFGFIGATSLLTANHKPEERAKVQGLNDFLVSATVAAAALSSGAVNDFGGWNGVVLAALFPVGIAALCLLWLGRAQRYA